MPKKEHRKLKRLAEKKKLKGERKDAYIYGTLQKIKLRRKKKHAC